MRVPSRIILDHELVLMTSGTAWYQTDTGEVKLRRGSVVLIRPFERHAFVSSDACEHIAIHFDLCAEVPTPTASPQDRQAYRVELTHGWALPGVMHLGARHRLVQPIESVVACSVEMDDLSLADARQALLGVLLWLIRRGGLPERERGGRGGHDARMRKAALYVEQHLQEPITPDDLAAHVDLSGSHFRRVFREWAGQSVMSHVTEQRVARARRLLADSALAVYEVASRVGYDDPYHFSRVFRRVDGVSPRQYRAIVLAGVTP